MTAEELPGVGPRPGLRFGATARLWAGHGGAASDRGVGGCSRCVAFPLPIFWCGATGTGIHCDFPPAGGACGSFEKSHDPFPLAGPHESRFGGETT